MRAFTDTIALPSLSLSTTAMNVKNLKHHRHHSTSSTTWQCTMRVLRRRKYGEWWSRSLGLGRHLYYEPITIYKLYNSPFAIYCLLSIPCNREQTRITTSWWILKPTAVLKDPTHQSSGPHHARELWPWILVLNILVDYNCMYSISLVKVRFLSFRGEIVIVIRWSAGSLSKIMSAMGSVFPLPIPEVTNVPKPCRSARITRSCISRSTQALRFKVYNAFGVWSIFRGSPRVVLPISSAKAIWKQNLGFQTLREVIH